MTITSRAVLPVQASDSLRHPTLTRLGRLASHGRLSTFISFITAPRDFLRAFFGEIEYVEGLFCDICSDVHREGEECPRLMIGECDICVATVVLDRFGNCHGGRYHRLSNRRHKL